MAKLLIRRKGFWRKAYTDKRGREIPRTWIPPTSFMAEDRGKKGRGKKVLPALKRGTLGGRSFFTKPTESRQRTYSSLAARIGEKKVMGKLRAIQVLNKRTNPPLSRKAASDARWVASSFRGRKRVKTGTGFA